jgi:acyl-CoA dehydrogenase
MLAEQVRGLLAERSPYDRLRSLINAEAEWDEPLWRELGEMGFLGAALPEAYGGLGMTALDQAVIVQELGRTNAAVPFFSTIVLCADAIRLFGSEAQKARWLPGLASGEIVGCFAYAEGPGPSFATGAIFTQGKLSGVKTPVADAGGAHIAVVLVAGNGLALVELDQSGITRTKLDSFDQLRAHYRIDFEGAAAEAMPGSGDIATLIDRAAVQAAFEGTGAAEACLEMARDYALDRQIFGRSLASFQAIKHKLAELAVQVELARSNAYFGAWAADQSPDDLPAAAASARLTALTAFETGARENIQVHGGIGYTQDANCHFYYRRERTLALALGSVDYWADRLINAQPGSQAKGA